MRFILCAIAAGGLLSACAHNQDMASADTGSTADVAATAPAPAYEPAPAAAPAPAPEPAAAPPASDAAARAGERG